MSEELQGFINYISAEEEHLLKSMVNFGNEFFLIENLDELFRSCFSLTSINKAELKIPAFLFTNVHREFYFGMASFLRLSQSKSFNSLRCAIDSGFTAYYLIKYPNKQDVYLSKINEVFIKEWDDTFRNIKRTIKKNIKEFPLVNNLPEMHEFCSIYAHSDALGIMHRYKENKEMLKIEVNYFDFEGESDAYKKWLGALLLGFFKVYVLFWHLLFKEFAGKQNEIIEQKIKEYEENLNEFQKQYMLRSKVI